MSEINFAKQFRTFRLRCRNPHNGKILTQQRLGELMGNELGTIGFSGAAVSDWERGASKIHADDRLVLVCLLKVLHQTGGIETLSEANDLLDAGNYRALNVDERRLVFQNEASDVPAEASKETFFKFPNDLRSIWEDAREGPKPTWPRMVTASLKSQLDRISILDTFRILVWFWLLVASYIMIGPSLYGTFPSREIALIYIVEYVCASLFLPPCIGFLTNTKDNPFWKQNNTDSTLALRLYTYQGAFIGFHLGYFSIFALQLLLFFFQVRLSTWMQFLLMSFPLFMGYVASQVVPHNLWRAYGRLKLSDGAIFFVFILLGPFWGWFFFEFRSMLISPNTGTVIILAAITLLVSLMTIQHQQKGNTIIPIRWWLILYGLILTCEIILIFIK
jgi:hypothetical protein